MPGRPRPQLLRWHWQKAGTIEHIHDITKNELGAGTPPSGRFEALPILQQLSPRARLASENCFSAPAQTPQSGAPKRRARRRIELPATPQNSHQHLGHRIRGYADVTWLS